MKQITLDFACKPWEHVTNMPLRTQISNICYGMQLPNSKVCGCYKMKRDCFIIQTTDFENRAKHVCKVWPNGLVTRFGKALGYIADMSNADFKRFQRFE